MEAGDFYISPSIPKDYHAGCYEAFSDLINESPFLLKHVMYCFLYLGKIQFEVINESFLEEVGGDRLLTMEIICDMREAGLDISNIDDYEKLL